MKNNISHLPAHNQRDLEHIVSLIREKCDDVAMIILFGSYARGDYKVAADIDPDAKSGHPSDYDLLVVTGRKETMDAFEIWRDLRKIFLEIDTTAHARVITHDIQELNIKLAEGQYFFSDVKKEGCVLFDSGQFTLAEERELTGKERQRIAQNHYDLWSVQADNFFTSYKFHIEQEMIKLAAFDLHQATESCFKCILLVFSNYTPQEHLLDLLNSMAEDYVSPVSHIFPKETEEEEELFKLLDYAYIGARYDPKFHIFPDEVETLAGYIKKLLDITKDVCEKKIKSFTETNDQRIP